MKVTMNGQKSTGANLTIEFNTANGFAENGIKFDGNYLKAEDKTYSKGIQFPDGKWMGYESLQLFFEYGAFAILDILDKKEESEDLEENLFSYRLKGICIHAYYCKCILEGMTPQEAKKETFKHVSGLSGLTKAHVKNILESDIFAV